MSDFLQEAKDWQHKIVEWRRILHRYPETGLILPETADFVTKQLRAAGVEYQTYPNHSGVTAIIGKGEGKTIAIRADMDALPIKEETGLTYASVNENMHACGHDAHTAMLITTACMLKAHEDELKGKVKLIFQPAEEGPGGADLMVKDGVLEGVDAILALHVGTLAGMSENGSVLVSYSNMFAADDQIAISIEGLGGHGSMPEKCVDPVTVAALIVNNVQYIVSREVPPSEATVITMASVEAGRGAYNIIPETASIKGTVRNGSTEVRNYVLKRIEEIAMATATMMRAKCKVEVLDGYPALINNKKIVESFLRSAKKILPEDEIHMMNHGIMGGEDAAFFFEKVPGCYFLLTDYAPCPADGKIYGAHHPKFCLDESVFYRGPALFTQAAVDWLEENEGTKKHKK
ncbi:MAG: M20 family metallopeptidase [Clostridium sp.]